MNTFQRYVPAYATLSVAAALTTPVSALEPLWLTVIAALVTLAAIAEHAGRREWPRIQPTLAKLLAALVIWGAASIIWSVAPDRSLSQAFELLLFAAGTAFLLSTALTLDPRGRHLFGNFLLFGFTLGLLLVFFELTTGGYVHSALNGHYGPDGTELTRAMNLFELNRASSVISLMLWIAIIPAWRRAGWVGACALIIVSLFAISKLQPGAPVLAVTAGAATFALAWFVPRFVAFFLMGTIVFGFVMIPALPTLQPILTNIIHGLGLSEFSLHHRMAIWQFASEYAIARPLTGWGLDASRLVGVGQMVTVNDAPNIGFRNVDVLPLHPHNATLQAWLELGVIGALIISGLFTAATITIRRNVEGRLERAASYATLAAALINAGLSFGVWQGWWISTLALVAVMLTALVYTRQPDAAVLA